MLAFAVAGAVLPASEIKADPGVTYYVSTSGDNTNDGLTPATAWRTITHAVANASSDDTIKVGPGIYADSG